MSTRLILLCGAVIGSALLVASTPAAAQTVVRECTYDPRTRTLECVVRVTPAPPRTVNLGSGEPGMRIPLQWSRREGPPLAAPPPGGSGGGGSPSVALPTCPIIERDGDEHWGTPYIVTLTNLDTGEVVRTELECVYPGEPPPDPPPPPPSLAEFMEAADLLLVIDAQINPDPAWGGITGLDTWLWCAAPSDVEISVTLRGWLAAATMNPIQYHWDITGPATAAFHPTECGTEATPAATWMPEMTGDYAVTLSATWAGTWTLTYGGDTLGTFVLGPIDIAAPPSPYPVGEHVGVLTNEVAP